MDNSLRALCDAIKKILTQLKPQTNQLSFILLTGKKNQGKSALLKQSGMAECPVFSEQHAKLYFNQKGILLELGENWLSHSKMLLQNTLKHLNKCSRYLKITGLALCVDVNDLLLNDFEQFEARKKAHLHLLERIGSNLGYKVDLGLIFTKMDSVAGFTEFYQTEHAIDLAKPLGFSLDSVNQTKKIIEAYSLQFTQLIEHIGQQVINKMHPARSTIKRSLIREFPLQLASLRNPIQVFLQSISTRLFHLHSIYFTSAEQGGVSIDRLNKKIQHEYELIVQDAFPQAANFRSYFVEGAVQTLQDQCSQAPQSNKIPQRPFIALAAGLAGLTLCFLFYKHYKTAHLLDEASKELLAYETLNIQGAGADNMQALYYLSRAAHAMDHIATNSLSLPSVHQLKNSLHKDTQHRIQDQVLPSLTSELEKVIHDPSNAPLVRYKALKIYLMLAQPEHFSAAQVHAWFQEQWETNEPQTSKKELDLLKDILSKPLNRIPIQQQIITDARNYLNALPTSYLYYSLAKEYFPKQEESLSVDGFNLAVSKIPVYFTKGGFEGIIQDIPQISTRLQAENWVLARQDLSSLQSMLTQAYCFNYVTWWQTFLRKSQPYPYQEYEQGRQLAKMLNQSSSVNKLILFVQEQTKPDISKKTSIFNEYIASQFTELNLISPSSSKELSVKIAELEQFISTLSVVHDGGRTAFSLARSRFINENSADPLSSLFAQARQLPEPLKSWTNQLASDTWSILIKDSRQYINQQWQQTAYLEFQNTIANRYPFEPSQSNEITIEDFNRFFSTHGVLNTFTEQYLKPFIDTTTADWKPKAVNNLVLPISTEAMDNIIRANIITNMFYPDRNDESQIEFSLQKISLDPIVSSLTLEIGGIQLNDDQNSDASMDFTWPKANARLILSSIDGNHYELAETGTWALFKLLEKVNVLVDEQDSSSLQILFEINSNSGRYLLKTSNKVNPFTPGILSGFKLRDVLV